MTETATDTFVVSTTDGPEEMSEPEEETPTPEELIAFETLGFGVVVALVALVAAALIGTRRQR